MHTVGILKNLWKNKAVVRALFDSEHSENFIFVRYFRPGHFYSPLPDLAELRRTANTVFDRSAKSVEAVDLNETRQVELFRDFCDLYQELPFAERQAAGVRYYLDNPFFSYGDGVILYSFMRHFRPKRIIEVGSGFSSANMLDVSDRFFESPVEFTFIEPRPERLYSLLSQTDRKRCRIETQPVQEIDRRVFDSLEENDILFVDSSHIGRIHSDVLHLLFNILPRLRAGVIVHFHDIAWPFEYPEHWVYAGRAFNEAYFLRAFLQYNSAFEILYFNSFMATHHCEAIRNAMPLVLGVPSTKETEGNVSLWLRKTN
jgi:predicted O-methyltransferase YrrM